MSVIAAAEFPNGLKYVLCVPLAVSVTVSVYSTFVVAAFRASGAGAPGRGVVE